MTVYLSTNAKLNDYNIGFKPLLSIEFKENWFPNNIFYIFDLLDKVQNLIFLK